MSAALISSAGVEPQWLPKRDAWVLFRRTGETGETSANYIRWCETRKQAEQTSEHFSRLYGELLTRPIRLSLRGKRVREVPLTLHEMIFMPEGDYAWVLFDTSNGDEASHRYLWWFDTRREAREHRAKQHANPEWVRLSRPVRMVIL